MHPPPRADYLNLDFTWRTPLWMMRRRFRRALAPHAGSLVVYHNGWGLPLFHDLDGAARRVVFLHASPAYHAPDLPSMRGLIDGVGGVTPQLRPAWEAALPEVTPDRGALLPIPIAPPLAPAPAAKESAGPLVLGYAGRLEFGQKRLDRLAPFLRALEAVGQPYRFEVLGDGSKRRALERRLAGRVHFHGWTPKAEFWRIMAGWDAIVFFSDIEGGPIAVLEAMSQGAIPFYPAIGGGWADIYAPQVDPRCHYPPGDMAALAAAIQQVFQSSFARLAAMRNQARALVAGHREEGYEAACLALLRSVMEQPRISRPRRRRPRVTDLLPLGMVSRSRTLGAAVTLAVQENHGETAAWPRFASTGSRRRRCCHVFGSPGGCFAPSLMPDLLETRALHPLREPAAAHGAFDLVSRVCRGDAAAISRRAVDHLCRSRAALAGGR